jgi:undecaprenyl-diphosphatase
VMHAGLRLLATGVRDEVRAGRLREGWEAAPATRLVALGLLTTVVTGVLGLVFRDLLVEVFGTPAMVAGALLATGTMLWWTDRLGPGRLGAEQVGIGAAVAVGIAQFAALTPGLSRSGTTIFVALLVGMHRTLAARYSFYVAIPTILAATGVQALDVVGDGGLTEVSWAAMVVGFVVAAVVGTAALVLVLRLLEQARFRIFSVYVWALAVVVLTTGLGT